MALACAAPGAAAPRSSNPFNDAMMKMNSVGPAFAPHSQDDLWTACGAYVDDGEAEGILSSVCSEDELSSMVSMVTSSSVQQQQQQRRQEERESHQHQQRRHSEALAASRGMHSSVPMPVSSFDSGSTGSHGSCTPPFSAGSPVTVLPPLPFSYPDNGKDHEPYVHFANGFWPPQDPAYDCDKTLLPSPGSENHFPSLLGELPLRPFNELVDGSRNDCRLLAISHQQQQSSVTSHVTCQTSDNVSGTSPSGSSSVSREYAGGTDCGSEYHLGTGSSLPASQAISCSTNRSSSPTSTPLGATAGPARTVPSRIDSEVSPAGSAGHVRLSWTDHHWPPVSNGINPLANTAFQGSAISSAQQHIPLPQHIVNAFQRNGNAQIHLPFHDADYTATCNQYRKTQLQDTVGGGVLNCNVLKRPFSTMRSGSSNVTATSSADANSSQALMKHPPSGCNQDAAALSALLYKNNHNAGLMSGTQSALASNPGTASNAAAAVATTTSSAESQPMAPPKLRRRHGTATDPQSIAARTRRERFSDRIRLLQSLVPNGERLDTVSMLGHTLEYVRFLQHKVWHLYNGADEPSDSEPDSESREKWKEFMDTTQLPIS